LQVRNTGTNPFFLFRFMGLACSVNVIGEEQTVEHRNRLLTSSGLTLGHALKLGLALELALAPRLGLGLPLLELVSVELVSVTGFARDKTQT